MIKQALIGEFLHEAENTRKLLQAIPDAALDYRPQPHLWSVGQLASHIAEVYNWFEGTFNIVTKFEENFSRAKSVLENSDESTYMNTWRMQMGGNDIMPPMPRVVVVRGFLYNHLYHHRGELVAHLRATGNTVPGLYGPSYEEAQAMMAR